MRTLVGYEVKKIIKRKSTIVVFFLLFLLNAVFVGFSGSLGSTYVDGEFYETHYERNQIERKNGIALSGRKIDDALFKEMQEAYQKIDWSSSDYKWTDTYKKEVRKYSDLEDRLKVWGLRGIILTEGKTQEKAYTSVGEAAYAIREDMQRQMYDSYGISEEETAYWEEWDAEVELPFTYQYAAAFESLVGMQGYYMVCMLLTFLIAITMVSVFVDEHNQKTDQLILCTRFGKGQLYVAKIMAGSLTIFVVTLLFTLTMFIGKFFSYGTEGFNASLQVALSYWYPYPISIGEACIILCGLLFLSSIMVAIFTMLLAEVLKNSVGAMAVIVGILFAARLVVIPPQWGILSQMWSYLPINMLKIDEGFIDLRLANVFGAQLTTWQFAPILYVILTAAMIWAGSKIYKNYQVSGR